MSKLFQATSMFKPIGYYPSRMALHAAHSLEPILRGKRVCDIGCAWGDLLEYMRVNAICSEVCGIELRDLSHLESMSTRNQYITYGNVFDIGVPDADVYLLWLGSKFDYRRLLDLISGEKTIVYLDGDDANQKLFNQSSDRLTLLHMRRFSFDESSFYRGEALKKAENYVSGFSHLNSSFRMRGERVYGVYKLRAQ